MAKVISQETYDDVIKENIVEFSMSVDEARKETIEQFEAQGVNLANIIKDLLLNEETGKPVLVECIEKLKHHSDATSLLTNDDLQSNLSCFIKECDKSVPHRVMATKNDSEKLLLEMIRNSNSDDLTLLNLLVQASAALINKQPDIFNSDAFLIAKTLIESKKDSLLTRNCLKWLQRACVMHEQNRQLIVDGEILPILKPFILSEDGSLVKEVCTLFRYLILDDDIRVEFGKAHEHARIIAADTLEDITKLLDKFCSNEELVGELMLTIASLTVRNEYCTVVESAGGLKFTLEALGEHPDSIKLVREGLKLLKALGGNDKVKVNIIQAGGAPLITTLLALHKSNSGIAKLALGCIATLSLRVQENGIAFFDVGAAEVIVETMKIHPQNKEVVRNAAWSIRNMVARSKDKADLFLSAGVEDCLNDALKDHPSIIQDTKSALRDLGAKVNLAEEWKNKAEKEIVKEY